MALAYSLRSCPYTVSGHHEPNVILKDNDLKYKLRLPLPTAIHLLKQVQMDADFLYSIGVCDYSLLGECVVVISTAFSHVY